MRWRKGPEPVRVSAARILRSLLRFTGKALLATFTYQTVLIHGLVAAAAATDDDQAGAGSAARPGGAPAASPDRTGTPLSSYEQAMWRDLVKRLERAG